MSKKDILFLVVFLFGLGFGIPFLVAAAILEDDVKEMKNMKFSPLKRNNNSRKKNARF